jgi:thioredoxin-like negative regulator of GroEL
VTGSVAETQYAVRAVPTLLFVRDGRELHRLVGKTAPDRLQYMIERKLLTP